MTLYCPYCGQRVAGGESDLGYHEFMGRQRHIYLVQCYNLECAACCEVMEEIKPLKTRAVTEQTIERS